jgi:3-hydroxyisobutyrate dehydrogenase-like beta-hydroxyacid dehydrogenase
MDIGFIGLGQMGAAIAGNLIKHGHRLNVWNRSPDKAQPLVEAGAKQARSPAEAAAAGEIVFTMLADDKAVEAVTFGEDGILSASYKPVHVSLSTISLALAERLEEAHGGRYVSAPVFGRPAVAAQGKLFVVAAGPQAAMRACREVLDLVGQRTFVVGDKASEANVVKLCGNFMIMAVVESLAEAMTLAGAHGVAKDKLLEVLTGSLFGAPIYQTYGQLLVEGKYRPAGFTAPLGLKDMNLVSAAATEALVPMPLLSLVRDRLLSTVAREGPDIDWAGAAKTVAEMAGR